MTSTSLPTWCASIGVVLLICACPHPSWGDSSWEITPQSRKALDRGLQWLQRNQGPEANWTTNKLGLVSMGLLAFLADDKMPGHSRFGAAEKNALDYVLRNAQPSGLLNIEAKHDDMYNHGLSTFVLGQADGMMGDPRVIRALDKALKVIIQSQCRDGDWRYESFPDARQIRYGNDLSLTVMQAMALRSAIDTGLKVPPAVIELVIRDVREHYRPQDCPAEAPEEEQKKHQGRFMYSKRYGTATLAMAAAGVVCLQEFAESNDWRIPKNIAIVEKAVREMAEKANKNDVPFDPYTNYYVAQSLYHAGGEPWRQCYPLLRDRLVSSQINDKNPDYDGGWQPTGHILGKPGMLFQTAVACFVLAIPNRYLPILQEGKIGSLRKQVEKK